MLALKLTRIGNSVGVILPKDVLARLKLDKGSTVFVTETPEGVALTPYDPRLEEQLKAGRNSCRNTVTPFISSPSDVALGRKTWTNRGQNGGQRLVETTLDVSLTLS